MKRKRIFVASLVAAVWLAAGVAVAGDVGDIDIHGFGSWEAVASDAYPYLGGAGEGDTEWDNGRFALNVSAMPLDRLRIHAQVELHTTDSEEETELDFAFAEWEIFQSMYFRAGLAKLPFGIYSEIYDVGTLRPFSHLPQSVYGPIGLIAENYKGIGITGRVGDTWELSYDLYLGGLSLEENEPWKIANWDPAKRFVKEEKEGESDEGEDLENVLGGRLVITAPVEGLSFGLSAYAGKPEADDEEDDDLSWGDTVAFGVQCRYETESLQLRTEVVQAAKDETFDAYYVEAAYRLSESWQIASRYEHVEADVFVEQAPSLTEHTEMALGINYWFSPNFVLKTSYHDTDGNLFAYPHQEPGEGDFEDSLEEKNSVIILGAAFSF